MSLKYFFLPEMVVCADCAKVDSRTPKMLVSDGLGAANVGVTVLSLEMYCPRCKAKGVVTLPIHTAGEVGE